MAYSNDLRLRAVEYFFTKGTNLRDVAAIFQIGLGTLHRWIERLRHTGDVNRLKYPGKIPIITGQKIPVFKEFVLNNADDTLAIMSEKWRLEHGDTLSISAVSKTIARI